MASKLDQAREDAEYRDSVVDAVKAFDADGTNPRGWEVGSEDGRGLIVYDELGLTRAPVTGDTIRLFGSGLGYPIRGIGLVDGSGALCGLYRYRTAEEEERARAQYALDEEARKRREWEEGKDEFAARVKALPEAFRDRLEFFMRRSKWGPDFGGYELFSCEEAVKIAKFVRTTEEIKAFFDDREAQRLAGISGEHSGNTFGTACRLAAAYMKDPELVPKMHGALCPLVGCRDYGCWATTQKGQT